MKILIVSENFYPKNNPRSHRTFELAKELGRQKHDVHVVFFSRDYYDFDYSSLEKEYGFKVHKVLLTYKGPRGRILSRIMGLFLAWPFIEIFFKMPKVFRSVEKADMIISIATPHPIHWGLSRLGKRIWKKCDVWVADCGDPYMGCKTDTYKPPFYFKYIEKRWCRLCDFITVPVESAKDGYYKEFHNKLRVIPQAFDLGDRTTPMKEPNNSVPTFMFAGGFIPGIRDPKLLLDYLSSCKNDFKFIIYTNNDSLLSDYKSKMGDKLEIHSYIPRNELLEKMKSMDFLVNIENGNTSVQVPSKLIDYALSGRPVLSVNSYKIDEGNIERFLNADYSGQMQMPDLDKYDIRVVAKQFLELYNEKMSKQ